MKLKKIASLALAGIMAVSMLAGCNGSSSSNTTEPENPVVPTTSGIAQYLNDMMSSTHKDLISFDESTAFRSNVLSVATDSSVITPNMIVSASDTTATKNTAVAGKIIEKYTNGTYNSSNDFNTWAGMTPTDASGVEYFVTSYVVDGDVNELTVADLIYSDLTGNLNALKSQVGGEDVVWSGDVAAVKVYNSRSADDTAWVIGVMVTKTVTNGTNTQV